MTRRLQFLAALAVIAMISSGCSNEPNQSDSGGTSDATRAKAMKFAQCMRDNGVKAFPDPDASGTLTVDEIANNSSVDTTSAAWTKAIDTCKDLEPAGFTGKKRSAKQQAAALKFAQCIRNNGVKDFPDPSPGEPLINTNRIPSTNASGGMSILNAAIAKCKGVGADELGVK